MVGLRGVREAVTEAGDNVSVAVIAVGLIALFAVALAAVAIVGGRRA